MIRLSYRTHIFLILPSLLDLHGWLLFNEHVLGYQHP